MVTPGWVRLGDIPGTCSKEPSMVCGTHKKVLAEQMLGSDAVFDPIVKLFLISHLNLEKRRSTAPVHHNGAIRLSF
jgi:hypothetical protein